MNKRKFSFEVLSVLLISVEAETEVEAWLMIKQLTPEQFSALPYNGSKSDWFVCTSEYSRSELLGCELPSDGSDIID